MYKKNLRIPGWNGEDILNVLGKYSSEIQQGGKILELGALFGRTTYTLGHNKPESIPLITIDIWPDLLYEHHQITWFHDRKCGIEEMALVDNLKTTNPDRLTGDNFYNLWKHFTDGIPNLTGIRALTSISNNDFPMFDLIVHDAGHDYKSVHDDLVHWFPKLKFTGSLIIDDYERGNFPELCDAVNKFVNENNLYTEMVTSRNILLRRR